VKPGKLTLTQLADMKSRGEKIVMVTAYDAPGARLAEQAGIDVLLIGDSAGMVVLGHDGTVPVTVEEMLFLTRSVSGAVERPLVVGDMPFGSYHVSDEDALRNAIRFVKEGGADVVKLEGAGPSLSRVRAIVAAGIGVMGHVGLTPQTETILGGFKTQGRTAAKARQLLADALALEAAGCFAIVLEAVPVPVAMRITESLTVPTIGIGAGAACDGQVLVYHDLLGLTEGRAPRFVKRYAHLAEEIRGALTTYAEEVRNGIYPAPEHTYAMPEDELELFSEAFSSARPEGGTASGASAERVEQRQGDG
jgi:3-methyl-2-oxobutanoate hydroxymethyltransferase